MVIDYIRKRENWHCLALKHATNCKNIKDYCDKIEKGDLQNDELEFRALAMLCCLLIRVFSITKTLEGNININVLNYGEHIESFTECIYILYDEENKHYDPLYAINKQKPDENITIFKRDDETIVQLVYIFLQEEFHYDANIQSDCNNLVVESDLPTEPNVLNETERIFNLATPSSSINLSNKRKTLNYDSLKWTQTIEQVTSSLSRSNSTYVSNKRIKSSKFDSSKNLSSNKNNSELLTIEQYLQMDINFNQFDSSNEKQKIENSQISLNNKFEIEKMKFEIEPTLKFRGRTLTDFKPKKAQKRNGEPSEPRPPRYFRDRNHRGYLNLLIPEAYLLPDIIQYYFEICIVTREINGYTYIHPYFKFQIHSTDPQSPNLNPKYIYFDSTIEFKTYSETLRQLKLQLVVVMHTNKELMQTKQPLKIFSSTQINNRKLKNFSTILSSSKKQQFGVFFQ
ncbi:unnamed protein product [Rotaria sordida]|uniref:Uncharacterized protein n=2 Tax=Rotaria sordida TaxID=392033 RepID=A0A818XHZ9_9BILA|nr:unnamed protein product [Rotaria sordida]